MAIIKKWNSISLILRILIGLVIGAALGLLLPGFTAVGILGTLFVGALDLATGRLSYCNGGHNAPYIQSDSLPVEPNLPVGAFPDWEFVEQETVMSPGSTIFLYTDGLTEAENATHDQFGEDRMTAILDAQTKQDASPETLISAMTDAVHQFVGDTEQSDDLTMLAIKYTKI